MNLGPNIDFARYAHVFSELCHVFWKIWGGNDWLNAEMFMIKMIMCFFIYLNYD